MLLLHLELVMSLTGHLTNGNYMEKGDNTVIADFIEINVIVLLIDGKDEC